MKANIFFYLLLLGLLAACQEPGPTPVAEVATELLSPTAAPSRTATAVAPTDTATALPATAKFTPQPSATATTKPTFTPSPTAEPSLAIQVVSEMDDAPIMNAEVQLVAGNDTTSAVTDENGMASFDMLATGNYSVTVTAVDYLPTTTTIAITEGVNNGNIALTAGLFVKVITDNSNLRVGPGTIYESVAVVAEGEMLEVVGRSDNGQWLVVQTSAARQGWISTSLVEAMSQLTEVAVVAAPATPTAVPTTVAAVPPTSPPPPPAAAPPSGINLLVNPGFESGEAGWTRRGPTLIGVNTVDSQIQFVHSGSWSIKQYSSGVFFQYIDGVTPGQTYRAGVWLKMWSSDGEDRHFSDKNPGDFVARICINIVGEDEPSLVSNVCSGFVRPLDVWQYIAVDAVASNERITVMLHTGYKGPARAEHDEVYWDDASLGGSPVMATATPVPFDPSVRPNPVPFAAVALRDNMNNVRSALEQMGGLLDRFINGSQETCAEYESYYAQLGHAALYDGVPGEWQGIYNEYVFAIDNGLRNDGIYAYCQHGDGAVPYDAYSTARQAVNQSLDRLIPVIEAANALLGG